MSRCSQRWMIRCGIILFLSLLPTFDFVSLSGFHWNAGIPFPALKVRTNSDSGWQVAVVPLGLCGELILWGCVAVLIKKWVDYCCHKHPDIGSMAKAEMYLWLLVGIIAIANSQGTLQTLDWFLSHFAQPRTGSALLFILLFILIPLYIILTAVGLWKSAGVKFPWLVRCMICIAIVSCSCSVLYRATDLRRIANETFRSE